MTVLARAESQGGCEGQAVLARAAAVLMEPQPQFVHAFVFLYSKRWWCRIQNGIGHALAHMHFRLPRPWHAQNASQFEIYQQ